MRIFDFLSASPKVFIFDKETHKTNLGGILFFIYIFIMILISLSYIVGYIINDKYSIEAMTYYNLTSEKTEEEAKILDKDIELNPFVNISITIFKHKGMAIYDRIDNKILEESSVDFYGQSYYFKRGVISNISLSFYYLCGEDEKCSSFPKYIESLEDPLHFGDVEVAYPGYKINHYDDTPVKIYENNFEFYFDCALLLDELGFAETTYEWEVIKYKDQKSLFDKITKRKTEFTFGHFISKDGIDNFWKYENYTSNIRKQDLINGYYIPLFQINLKNPHKEYIEDKRKKVELIDIIASIGALFSTIKYFFVLIFSFYSKNFDNYKVINKILNSPKKPNTYIELSSEFNKILLPLNKEEKLISNENNEKNAESLKDENKLNIKDSNTEEKDTENSDDEFSPIILKKLSFFDFFFNNIYSKCCKRIKNQEIINITNEIIYKYLSVDSLLYNQIKLENLFKDYKWKNPSLNNILNNQMIMKLKNI